MTVRNKSEYEKIIYIDNDSILETSFKCYILKNGLFFINNNFPNGVFNRACFLKNNILHHFFFFCNRIFSVCFTVIKRLSHSFFCTRQQFHGRFVAVICTELRFVSIYKILFSMFTIQ